MKSKSALYRNVCLVLLFFAIVPLARGGYLPFPQSPPATSGSVLTSTSTGVMSWVSPLPLANGGTSGTSKSTAFDALSPMSAAGDIIYGGTSGTGTRLAKGTANQLVGMNNGATAPEYKTASVGTSGSDFAIVQSANAIAFNLPDASASARGATTSSAQTFGGAKTFTADLLVAPSGATTTYENTNGGGAVSLTSPVALLAANDNSTSGAGSVLFTDTVGGSFNEHFLAVNSSGSKIRIASIIAGSTNTAGSETGTLTLSTKPSGGTATAAVTIGNDQIATFAVGAKFLTSGGTPATLDYFSQGTWVPVLTTTGTNFTGVTYTANGQVGYYSRLGKMVFYTCSLGWTGTTGSPTGGLVVSGLPVASRNTAGLFTTAGTDYSNIDIPASTTQLFIEINPGTTIINVYSSGDGIAAASVLASANGGAAGRSMTFSGVYFTD